MTPTPPEIAPINQNSMLEEHDNPSRRQHCPNCGRRIHPLDLSDLHRGQKVECAYCHSTLHARTLSGTGSVFGTAVALWPMAQDMVFSGVTTLHALLFAATVLIIIWLAPPGLVSGAPWVRIAATLPDSADQQVHESETAFDHSEP